MRNNPQDPEYLSSFRVNGKIRNHQELQCEFIDHSGLSKANIINLIANDTNTVCAANDQLCWFKEAFIWRKNKKILIGVGNLVIKKDCVDLLLITGIVLVKKMVGKEVGVVIGHKIEMDAHYHLNDKNPRATISRRNACWLIDEIETKVIYSHLCDDLCEINVDQDGVNHNWNAQPRIVIFWWIGLGRDVL